MTFKNTVTPVCGSGVISELKFVGIKPEVLPSPKWKLDWCGNPFEYNDMKVCTQNHLDIKRLKRDWTYEC